jgi:hypothetical protein
MGFNLAFKGLNDIIEKNKPLFITEIYTAKKRVTTVVSESLQTDVHDNIMVPRAT